MGIYRYVHSFWPITPAVTKRTMTTTRDDKSSPCELKIQNSSKTNKVSSMNIYPLVEISHNHYINMICCSIDHSKQTACFWSRTYTICRTIQCQIKHFYINDPLLIAIRLDWNHDTLFFSASTLLTKCHQVACLRYMFCSYYKCVQTTARVLHCEHCYIYKLLGRHENKCWKFFSQP
jgi:hypothetical protein